MTQDLYRVEATVQATLQLQSVPAAAVDLIWRGIRAVAAHWDDGPQPSTNGSGSIAGYAYIYEVNAARRVVTLVSVYKTSNSP